MIGMRDTYLAGYIVLDKLTDTQRVNKLVHSIEGKTNYSVYMCIAYLYWNIKYAFKQQYYCTFKQDP